MPQGSKLVNIGYRLNVILDTEDIPKVLLWRWNLSGGKSKTTIQATVDRKSVTLARYILNYDGPLEIDHRDRDIYNNSKTNFRYATKSQQMANTVARNGKKYKGVVKDKRRSSYSARLTKDGVCHSESGFCNELSAAIAYDRMARKYHGEFARLNFPSKACNDNS